MQKIFPKSENVSTYTKQIMEESPNVQLRDLFMVVHGEVFLVFTIID